MRMRIKSTEITPDEALPWRFLIRGTIAVPVLFVLALVVAPGVCRAGPPYLTDDPDPVAYQHWELYLGSQFDAIDSQGVEGTLPHFEINVGVLDGAMLHLLIPVGFIASPGSRTVYGPGDIEVGANIRLLEEARGRPQIGTFPIVAVPTGAESQDLGSGTVAFFLPIWLMKNIGSWTIDGGGGIHVADRDADAELGAFVQRSLGEVVSLGAEGYLTVPFDGTQVRFQLDLGLILDLSETHHLLFSGGPSFGAVGGGQAYASWLVTP